jgi:hypothetical protein
MGSKDNWIKEIGKIAALAITGYMGSTWFIRKGIEKVGTNFIHRIMVDPYHENLWEPISASRKVGVQNIVEANLRSQHGRSLNAPWEAQRHFLILRM